MTTAEHRVGFERSVVWYVPQRPLRDAPLRAQLRELAAAYPRWGVPRLHWRLRRNGLPINDKRVERLYRLEHLAVRRRDRKRLAVPRVPRLPVDAPNTCWSIDFVRDQLSNGRASVSDRNQCWFRHSSRNIRLKRSMWAFWMGSPDWMNCRATWWSAA